MILKKIKMNEVNNGVVLWTRTLSHLINQQDRVLLFNFTQKSLLVLSSNNTIYKKLLHIVQYIVRPQKLLRFYN